MCGTQNHTPSLHHLQQELLMLQSSDHHDNVQSGSLASRLPFAAFLPVVELISAQLFLKTVVSSSPVPC